MHAFSLVHLRALLARKAMYLRELFGRHHEMSLGLNRPGIGVTDSSTIDNFCSPIYSALMEDSRLNSEDRAATLSFIPLFLVSETVSAGGVHLGQGYYGSVQHINEAP